MVRVESVKVHKGTGAFGGAEDKSAALLARVALDAFGDAFPEAESPGGGHRGANVTRCDSVDSQKVFVSQVFNRGIVRSSVFSPVLEFRVKDKVHVERHIKCPRRIRVHGKSKFGLVDKRTNGPRRRRGHYGNGDLVVAQDCLVDPVQVDKVVPTYISD